MSRGLRNANPGNIRLGDGTVRYRGESTPSRDRQFREFESIEWGYRALFVLLYTYQKRHHLLTPAAMIARWAPPQENQTEAYVRFVCLRCGLTADTPIDSCDREVMIPFAAAISRMENGVEPHLKEVEQGWQLFWEDYASREES